MDSAGALGASAGGKAFALLNQMMAVDFGGGSHFGQAAAPSAAATQQPLDFLAKALH
jgi:hypothetical protein